MVGETPVSWREFSTTAGLVTELSRLADTLNCYYGEGERAKRELTGVLASLALVQYQITRLAPVLAALEKDDDRLVAQALEAFEEQVGR